MLSIEAEVILMLFDVDGFDWFKEEINSPIVFHELCAVAMLLRRPNVVAVLNEIFGAHQWEKRYREYLKRNTDYWSQKYIEASKKSICLRASSR